MRESPRTVLINGKEAKIQYNKSRSKDWTIEDSNIHTLEILDELMKFKDSSVKYSSGITVINGLTTRELMTNTSSTRPSNDIGILRHETPPNTVITYTLKDERLPKYGIMKSASNIKILEHLRERMLKYISKSDETKNRFN